MYIIFYINPPTTLIIWKMRFLLWSYISFKILWLMSNENSTCRILVKRIGVTCGSLLSTLVTDNIFSQRYYFLTEPRNNHCTFPLIIKYFYLTVYIMWYISKKESNYIYVHKIAHLGKVWTDTYMNRGPGGEQRGPFFFFLKHLNISVFDNF